MKDDVEKLIAKYRATAITSAEATNVAIGNINAKKHFKIRDIVRADVEMAKQVFIPLLSDANVHVAFAAAVDLLYMRMEIDKALAVIEKVKNSPELGWARFDAEMVLELWHENRLFENPKPEPKQPVIMEKSLKADLSTLQLKYRAAAISHGEAIESGNPRVANTNLNKLVKIYQVLETDLDVAKRVLVPFLDDSNIHVAHSAANDCLGLKIEIEKALEVLKRVVATPNLRWMSFVAKETLESWNKEGKLTIYSKKNKPGETIKTDSRKKIEPESGPKVKMEAWRASEIAGLYYDEVMNGGHQQFFHNNAEMNYEELVGAIELFGAKAHADILRHALWIKKLFPAGSELYSHNMSMLDTAFYDVQPELCEVIEEYLAAHESD